jgi:hypothetical protein
LGPATAPDTKGVSIDGIEARRNVAEGQLYDDVDAAWPYLVTTRRAGVSWRDAGLSIEQKLSVAAELGSQVRRVHALRPACLRRTRAGRQ